MKRKMYCGLILTVVVISFGALFGVIRSGYAEIMTDKTDRMLIKEIWSDQKQILANQKEMMAILKKVQDKVEKLQDK